MPNPDRLPEDSPGAEGTHGPGMVGFFWRILCERETLILILAVAVLCCVRYHFDHDILAAKYSRIEVWLTQGTLLLATSFLFSLLILRENPLRFGLGMGDARTWAKWLLPFAAVTAAAILVLSRVDESFARYYPIYGLARESHTLFIVHTLSYVFYFFAWEYFCRGFLLFSLEKRFGSFAVVLQMVPFVMAHIGKPELEVYSSILGGLVLGVLAIRTRSMWPCFLIHAFIAVWMDVCVVYVWG